jgi:hypothetical protein
MTGPITVLSPPRRTRASDATGCYLHRFGVPARHGLWPSRSHELFPVVEAYDDD